MSVRDFTEQDRDVVLGMVAEFYNSPAVDHPIPVENFATVYADMCDGGSAYLRGLLIESNGQPAGFCSLSRTYSTEAGGPVVLIEEAFIRAEFRGKGLGESLFRFIKDDYRGKAARLRLEVAKDNTRAQALYQRLGFETLPYVQMINEDF